MRKFLACLFLVLLCLGTYQMATAPATVPIADEALPAGQMVTLNPEDVLYASNPIAPIVFASRRAGRCVNGSCGTAPAAPAVSQPPVCDGDCATCPNTDCPDRKSEPQAMVDESYDAAPEGRRPVVRAVGRGVGKILGIERRQARRAARRG